MCYNVKPSKVSLCFIVRSQFSRQKEAGWSECRDNGLSSQTLSSRCTCNTGLSTCSVQNVFTQGISKLSMCAAEHGLKNERVQHIEI